MKYVEALAYAARNGDIQEVNQILDMEVLSSNYFDGSSDCHLIIKGRARADLRNGCAVPLPAMLEDPLDVLRRSGRGYTYHPGDYAESNKVIDIRRKKRRRM